MHADPSDVVATIMNFSGFAVLADKFQMNI